MLFAIIFILGCAYGQGNVTIQDEQIESELEMQLASSQSNSILAQQFWARQPDSEWNLITKAFFGNIFTGWQIANNKGGGYFSTCGFLDLVGGYNILGVNGRARVIESKLPQHTSIKFLITLFKIDDWDGKTIAIAIDGKWLWQQVWSASTGISSMCGNPNSVDSEIFVIIETPHVAEQITIEIVTNLAKDASLGIYQIHFKASWGFREYQLSYK